MRLHGGGNVIELTVQVATCGSVSDHCKHVNPYDTRVKTDREGLVHLSVVLYSRIEVSEPRRSIEESSSMERPELSIVNAAVWVGDSFRDGPIHVARGTIVGVGEGPTGSTVIDGENGFVIPGLIDAHFHAYAVSIDLQSLPRSSAYVALAGAARLRRALRRGFTTVRDVAGGDIGLSHAIEQGIIQAPRYFFTGPALSQTGGHGDPRSPEEPPSCCGSTHMSEVVDGTEALRTVVRERFRTGAHAIKIMTSGGVVSPSDPLRIPQYSAEEVSVVAEEANRRGGYVAAHAYSSEAIRHSVLNGVRTIEHGNLLDADTAAVMADHDAFLVPTLAAYDAMDRRGSEVGLSSVAQSKNGEVLRAGRDAISVAQQHGVRVGWGSDLMGPLEDDQLRGLALQAEVMSPTQLLRSVTTTNAHILGRPDLATIAVGSVADLLILPGDPIADPALLWTQLPGRTVIARGKVVGDA